MTTAWAYAVRGNAQAAVDANFAGVLLLVTAVGAAAWTGATAVAGRWWVVAPSPRGMLWIATACLVATLVDWARRLAA